MRIKKYQDFISENTSNLKFDLIKYFDEQKSEMISKGLDFDALRDKFIKSIDALDPNFLQKATLELSQVDISNKNEFTNIFENILVEICHQLEKVDINESFISAIKNIWSEVKKLVSDAAKWIADRIWTISGYLTMSLAALLFIINTWGGGMGMPELFGNVVVNTVLMIGIALLKFGKNNDNYKNISEI